MPSGQIASPLVDSVQLDSTQIKLCAFCHGSLNSDISAASYFNIADSSDSPAICNGCREMVHSSRLESVPELPALTQMDSPLSIDIAARSNETRGLRIDTQTYEDHTNKLDIDVDPQSRMSFSPMNVQVLYNRSPTPPENVFAAVGPSRQLEHSNTRRDISPVSSFTRSSRHSSSPVDAYPSPVSAHGQRDHGSYFDSSPDPMIDITRIRVRSQGYGCLYPGAEFQGTQKSGRNSYDVNVTIVDVDFSSSFLCGYLRIRGLTDDWPELTTYFDADIIGSRHGFLTQDWGASEQEDMVHWARFPAFRHVQNELQKPRLTMKDRDRGAVFMRWKERFLVPDHRVQDINGASFAGFYYVCVDFNPPPLPCAARAVEQEMPVCPESDIALTPPSTPPKQDTPTSAHRTSAGRLRRPSYSSLHPPEEPVATMCGFYFHQNSEPYQQLSLTHVKEQTTSSFEFR